MIQDNPDALTLDGVINALLTLILTGVIIVVTWWTTRSKGGGPGRGGPNDKSK